MFTKSKTYICAVVLVTLLSGARFIVPGVSHRPVISHPANTLLSAPVDYYGKAIDVLGLFGQQRISETGRNLVNGNGIYHAPGVLVDRNSPPDRLYIYVVDSGNNRILGFNFNCAHGSTCQMDGSRPANIVIGQPDMTAASCNRDNNLGFNKSPAASTLCLLGYPLANNTAEAWMRINIDVDSQGNLYVPDVWNNRVLKFNQPLSADRTAGKGDSVADYVWGQDTMTSNGRNRGPNYGDPNPPDNHSLWISSGQPFFDHVTSRGVSVDPAGNVWVADTFNSRILRFPPNSKNANLVLGQTSFTASGCFPNGPLNKMCTPTLARVHPTTGDLYVLDEYPAPFFARLLVFRPPFTNGMTAYKTIIPDQGGPFTNWEGWDGTGSYRFQSTGFIFNTFRQGEYASGEIWLNEHSANRTLLIDFDGNIVKVIGAQNKFLRGGDSVYFPECGSIEEGNRLVWPGGSIGMDNANNIYLADEGFQTVYRYALPYNTRQVGGVTCLPDANGVLFPKGPNHRSSARLGESVGMVVAGDQLLVRDEGMRLKVYNDYQLLPFGANATFELTGGLQGRNWLSGGVDDSNRLWLSGEHGQIRIYQLPLASQSPIADFVRLYWADTGLEVTRPDGSDYVPVGAMAFDSIQKAMYIADESGTRIFRVRNYDQFADKLLVDMVIGQRNKTEVRCNQGLSSPNSETLCRATQIKFDTLGNLFVVDNAYECQGNQRIVVFEASTLNGATGLFPRLRASKVFNAPGFNTVGACAYWTVDAPGSPVSLAFNSKNQMVVGNDGYYGDPSQRELKQLWFYSNPMAKQTPDASIDIYMGTPGELDFDENDNLLIQDHTWYKVWMINLGCDPEWLSYLPGATIPVLPFCGEGDPVSVTVGGEVEGVYALTPNESSRVSYPGVNRGPVQIESSQATPTIAAERVIYKVNGVNTSFTEMMGLPQGQLDTTYHLPWYNNVDLDTQLRIANVSGSQATVTVTIGGVARPSFNLAAGASTRLSYAGVNNGPVRIVSTQNIVAAERVIYKVNNVNTSFTEMMALPNRQLDNVYYLPWYNNVDLDTQLRIANVSGSQATITVTIGGVPQPSFNLAAGASTRVSYAAHNGPVKIQSTQNIVAAGRVIYKVNGKNTSFSELMALPENQLGTTYWLPWYNNVDLDTQLRIANVSGSQATVTVTVGGVLQPSFNLAAGASTRVSYAANNGPVKIVSTHGVPIVAAERVIYKVNNIATSFSEMMSLPHSQLDTIYWFPWYNNVDLDTQLRFGVP